MIQPAAHTPGRWRPSFGNLIRINASGKHPVTIAGVHRLGRFLGREREDETIANAHVLAAAPRLLEALRKADAWLPENAPGSVRAEIRAAIAEAEGRGHD